MSAGHGLPPGGVAVNNSGAIATTGRHAIWVLTQSIGGGGGLAKVVSTDQMGPAGKDPIADAGDQYRIALTFGGTGSGGAVAPPSPSTPPRPP